MTDTNTEHHNKLMGFQSYPEAYGALAGHLDVLMRHLEDYEEGQDAELTVDRMATQILLAHQVIRSFRHQQ